MRYSLFSQLSGTIYHIQLGMLYNVRSQQFISGILFWKNSKLNAAQATDNNKKVQNAQI